MKIRQTSSSAYPPRTYYNATNSDITIAFAVDFNTPGERLTRKASEGKIVSIDVTKDNIVKDYLKEIPDEEIGIVVNIAGNSIVTLLKRNVTQNDIDQCVYEFIEELSQYRKIKKIRCGGQSGADIAGAKAGYRLNIPVTITMPQGYLTRESDGKDRTNTKDTIRNLAMSTN